MYLESVKSKKSKKYIIMSQQSEKCEISVRRVHKMNQNAFGISMGLRTFWKCRQAIRCESGLKILTKPRG